MIAAQTPERLLGDPTIAQEQATNLAALQKLAVEPPSYYPAEALNTRLQALGMRLHMPLFVQFDQFGEIAKFSRDLEQEVQYNSDFGVRFAANTDSVIAFQNQYTTTRIGLCRGSVLASFYSEGRTHTVRGDVGPKLYFKEQGLPGNFLEFGLAWAFEKSVTLDVAETKREKAQAMNDYPWLGKDWAGLGVLAIIQKCPSLLNTMLHTRRTFAPEAEEQLKTELDDVMGDGFYEAIIGIDRGNANLRGGFELVKKRLGHKAQVTGTRSGAELFYDALKQLPAAQNTSAQATTT